MPLDMWFKQDVQRILASKAVPAMRQSNSDYRDGYLDALQDIGIAFGLVHPVTSQIWFGRDGASDDDRSTLDIWQETDA